MPRTVAIFLLQRELCDKQYYGMVLAASAPPADVESVVVVEPADTKGGFDIGIPPLSGGMDF